MERDVSTPWQRAAAVAAGQRGLLTSAQAIAAGLSEDQVLDARRRLGWQRLARGLYALPGSTPTWRREATAARLLAGDDALVSHVTAAALWGWCPPPVLPHVTVPRGQSHRSPRARVHRSDVAAVDRAVRDGIRCTSAARTIVDCAGVVERARLEELVDDALCARVATAASVRAAADRAGGRGRVGAQALRAVLDVWVEDIRPGSPAEVRLLRVLGGLGVVGVVTQHEIRDESGRLVGRVDAAVPDRRIGFEYDSDRWHNPRRWDRDEPRYAAFRALGWRVQPVCKHDLLPSSTRLADLLAAAWAAA